MLCRWSENIVQYFDIDRSDARKTLAERTTAEFYFYLRTLAAERRRARRDDLITRLAVAQDAGTLSHDEFIHRHAAEDVELAGRAFAKGTTFGLLYGAAKRDPAVFTDPNRFDVARAPNRHLAFGYGAHLCLGNHLARMTLETVFGALLARTRDITLLQEPEWKRGLSARGRRALTIELIPA